MGVRSGRGWRREGRRSLEGIRLYTYANKPKIWVKLKVCYNLQITGGKMIEDGEVRSDGCVCEASLSILRCLCCLELPTAISKYLLAVKRYKICIRGR